MRRGMSRRVVGADVELRVGGTVRDDVAQHVEEPRPFAEATFDAGERVAMSPGACTRGDPLLEHDVLLEHPECRPQRFLETAIVRGCQRLGAPAVTDPASQSYR